MGSCSADGAGTTAPTILPINSGGSKKRSGNSPRVGTSAGKISMELIGAIVVALLAILGTAASRQITDEFKAWTPACVRYLIGCAVQQLSKDQRGRFAEEWSSHVSEVPGEIGKLVVAFGFLKAAWKMSPDLQRDVPFAVCKRAIDLFFSCLALALLAPLLIAFAISIKLETRGPVLFVQARRGYKDKIIRLAKFRTAYLGGNGNPQATRVGRLLRKLNLDELPQLLNVLVGDMSLVGPRPRSVLPEPSKESLYANTTPSRA